MPTSSDEPRPESTGWSRRPGQHGLRPHGGWPPGPGREMPAEWAARRRHLMRRFVALVAFLVVALLLLLVAVGLLGFVLAGQGTLGVREGLLLMGCLVAPLLSTLLLVAVGLAEPSWTLAAACALIVGGAVIASWKG